jgi:hypothetical protein
LTTEQEIQENLPEQISEKSPDKAPEKASEKPAETAPKKAAKKSTSSRKKNKPPQRIYDHVPIIIFLLVIFSFTLLCVGIGLSRYLNSERAGIPACGRVPCSSPFSTTASQKGGGE